jgi:hypothetical protein
MEIVSSAMMLVNLVVHVPIAIIAAAQAAVEE